MSVARFAFGPRLKAHRERQGITLQDIAETTKIGVPLLSSLERNDCTQWPKGIYRRAFLRSYTRAINVPFDPTWAEFTQLFPEDGTAPVAASFAEATQLRLTFAAGAYRLPTLSSRNVLAAAVDAGIPVVVGLLCSLLPGVTVWMGIAVISLIYGAASTVLVGGSPTRWFLRAPRVSAPTTIPDHDPVIAAEVESVAPTATPQRPRIFAVPSTRTAATSSETRARRVADR